MSTSRREFLVTSAALLGASTGAGASQSATGSQPPPSGALPSGSPPVFGTATGVGPDVTAATFAEAEKLMRVRLSAAQRAEAASNWRDSMAPLYELRTGPRRVELPPGLAPGSQWNPVLPGHTALHQVARFVGSGRDPGPMPASDAEIAFAPLWKLSRWVRSRQLQSERL